MLRTPSLDTTTLASDLLPAADVACVLLGAAVSTVLLSHVAALSGAILSFDGDRLHATLVAAAIAPFVLYDRNFGAAAARGQLAQRLRSHGLRFALLCLVLWLLGHAGAPLTDLPAAWLSGWLALSLMLTVLVRIAAALYLRRLQQGGALQQVVAVVGAGPTTPRLLRELRGNGHRAIDLLGVFDDRSAGPQQRVSESSGTLAQLLDLGRRRRIDWILLTLPHSAEARLQHIVQRLGVLSVPIALCPRDFATTVPGAGMDFAGDTLAVNLLVDRPIRRWDAVLKAAEDLLLGGLMTLLLLPLMAAIAVAIKATSPGPVIYRQRRHAVDNREFEIYKFRTMTWMQPDGMQQLRQTSRDDARVTAVGRFLRSTSMDELPQLFNVLQGDMSLVGPRPHAVDMRTENRLGSDITDIYAHRHRVKPGITGWSQVNGARGATDTTAQLQRRVELDLYYIDNWSLLLDLRILLKTVRVVLDRANTY